MRTIHLRALVPADDAAAAFDRVIDFAGFPSLATDLRSVVVHPAAGPGLPRHSDWEIIFRRGIMRWSERETIDRDRLRLDFVSIGGDFAELSGSWQLTHTEQGCEVALDITYDFGIDSLAGLMDPLAERLLKRAVCSILLGLFGELTVLAGGECLTDLVPAAAPRPARAAHSVSR